MNRGEHLLTILSEECGEVVQAASKAKRFGMNEGRDITGTNALRLKQEINDIYAMIEMVQCEFDIDLEKSWDMMNEKQKKVEKFLIYSEKCGTLRND